MPSKPKKRTGSETELVEQLVWLLEKGSAHAPFDAAVRGLEPPLRGVRPEGAAHSAWQLVEHLRLAQRDILDFCREKDYVEGKFPDDYWPTDAAPPDSRAWDRSVRGFRADLRAMVRLVRSPKIGPYARVAAAGGKATI